MLEKAYNIFLLLKAPKANSKTLLDFVYWIEQHSINGNPFENIEKDNIKQILNIWMQNPKWVIHEDPAKEIVFLEKLRQKANSKFEAPQLWWEVNNRFSELGFEKQVEIFLPLIIEKLKKGDTRYINNLSGLPTFPEGLEAYLKKNLHLPVSDEETWNCFNGLNISDYQVRAWVNAAVWLDWKQEYWSTDLINAIQKHKDFWDSNEGAKFRLILKEHNLISWLLPVLCLDLSPSYNMKYREAQNSSYPLRLQHLDRENAWRIYENYFRDSLVYLNVWCRLVAASLPDRFSKWQGPVNFRNLSLQEGAINYEEIQQLRANAINKLKCFFNDNKYYAKKCLFWVVRDEIFDRIDRYKTETTDKNELANTILKEALFWIDIEQIPTKNTKEVEAITGKIQHFYREIRKERNYPDLLDTVQSKLVLWYRNQRKEIKTIPIPHGEKIIYKMPDRAYEICKLIRIPNNLCRKDYSESFETLDSYSSLHRK